MIGKLLHSGNTRIPFPEMLVFVKQEIMLSLKGNLSSSWENLSGTEHIPVQGFYKSEY